MFKLKNVQIKKCSNLENVQTKNVQTKNVQITKCSNLQNIQT
jgi:hypothetical protein